MKTYKDFGSYEDFISSIKEVAKSKKKIKTSDENYICYHKHHIIPKCFGGTNDSENLILLTCEEHIIAHILLCKKYENNVDKCWRMSCALMRLLTGIKDINDISLDDIDIEEAGRLLEKRAQLSSITLKGKKKAHYTSPFEGLSEEDAKELHESWSNRLKGIKRSDEYKKHMSDAQKRNPNNPMVKAAAEGTNFFKGKKHSEETKKHLSEMRKGVSIYTNMTDEEKQKTFERRSAANKGENNPCFGKKRYVCLETGKQVCRSEHPGEGYVTLSEFLKIKNKNN